MKPPWRKPGDARRRAIGVAIGNARERLYYDLLKVRLSEELTVEQLAAVSPEFDAHLRALVSDAESDEVQEGEQGAVLATVRVDLNEVRRLARPYLPDGQTIQWPDSADEPDWQEIEAQREEAPDQAPE